MIYLRLKGTIEDIFAQIAYAEKISRLYNQEIALYINGSKDNKEYYEKILIPSGIFAKYEIVETYPITEEVLFEDSPNFDYEVSRRGEQGLDIVIEGEFYYLRDIDYSVLKEVFEPAEHLLTYFKSFGMTDKSLYIEAQPLLVRQKDEFALAGRLLQKQLDNFKNKNFDKVFVVTDYPEFFMTAGFEEITRVENISYIFPDDIPMEYRDAAKVMFPYLCGSSIISNFPASWWGHVLNKYQTHEIGILFPYGKIKRVDNAPDGISNELITAAIMDVFHFGGEERKKQYNGEPSAYDNVFFEKEIEELPEDSGSTEVIITSESGTTENN